MKEKIFVGEIDNPAATPEAILDKMERRAKRSVGVVERRAKQAVEEIRSREEEYLEMMDDRIDQLKERHFVDRGVDKRVTAVQDGADVLEKEISAISAEARRGINDRVKHFKAGIAIVRIEVDADILTSEAACSFVDQVWNHARQTQERIDNDFADADADMRRRVNKLEPMLG